MNHNRGQARAEYAVAKAAMHWSWLTTSYEPFAASTTRPEARVKGSEVDQCVA